MSAAFASPSFSLVLGAKQVVTNFRDPSRFLHASVDVLPVGLAAISNVIEKRSSIGGGFHLRLLAENFMIQA